MAAINSKSKKTAKKPQKTAKKPIKKAHGAPKDAAKVTVIPPVPPKQAGLKFTPTGEQRSLVMLGTAIGMTETMMCDLIVNPETQKPISRNTLRQHFPEELNNGHALVMLQVAQTLVKVAKDANHPKAITAAIYLSKVLGKWREPEPEWSEKKRHEAQELAERKGGGTGWTIVNAAPVLEEPKPEMKQLPSPGTTLQ